jgi:protein SCO1
MTSRVFLIALTGLLAGAVAALTLVTRAPPQAGISQAAPSTGKALIGGPFTLTDTAGKSVTHATFAGRPMLVYFGFTHCPDICPSGLQIISSALDQLGANSTKVSALFITLDPERDTAAKLGEYLKSFNPQIIGLTGTADEIATATKAYRVYAKKVASEAAPADYSIDHSGFMYLMDRNGEYVTHFPHNTGADKLSSALTQSIAKS